MIGFKFFYKGKKIYIEVEECRSVFEKMRGLMFRKKSKPLLFIFKKPVRNSIHSFFCLPFVAIWFNNGKIIKKKYVKPWKIFVSPEEKFDRLLEIPIGNKEFKLFTDERKI